MAAVVWLLLLLLLVRSSLHRRIEHLHTLPLLVRRYVTECVVNEGLRLLLGGPMRDTWLCPYIEQQSQTHDDQSVVMAYNGEGRFLHPPHTVDSVYECSLASGCGLECREERS